MDRKRMWKIMTLNIRKMESKDVAALTNMEQQCFTDPWSEKMMADLLDSSWDEVWVLEESESGDGTENLVGYINYRFIAGEGELMRIAVLPSMRGRGYSRKLMDVMVKAAAENGVSDITLEVRAGNAPAIGLYKSYGFVSEAVRKGDYDNPTEDADIMWLRGLPSIPT